MENIDIRRRIEESGFYMYEVAHEVGITDSTLSKWLRTPLTNKQKERINEALLTLSNKNEEVSSAIQARNFLDWYMSGSKPDEALKKADALLYEAGRHLSRVSDQAILEVTPEQIKFSFDAPKKKSGTYVFKKDN